MATPIPLNKLNNLSNHYQGKTKKVLCVCSAGMLGSPTAANVLHSRFGYNTRACGVSKEYALIMLDDVLATWADEIVAVHPEVASLIDSKWIDKLVTLNIPDLYPYMDNELIHRILDQYSLHLGEQIEDTAA